MRKVNNWKPDKWCHRSPKIVTGYPPTERIKMKEGKKAETSMQKGREKKMKKKSLRCLT